MGFWGFGEQMTKTREDHRWKSIDLFLQTKLKEMGSVFMFAEGIENVDEKLTNTESTFYCLHPLGGSYFIGNI